MVVDSLIELAKKTRRTDKAEALKILEQARAIAEEKSLSSVLGNVQMAQGITIRKDSTFLSSYPFYEESIESFRVSGDSAKLANALALAGVGHMVMSNFTQSIDYLLEAASINETLPQTRYKIRLGGNYRNVGNVYIKLEEYDLAQKYLDQAKAVFESIQDTAKLLDLQERYALLEYGLKNYDAAEAHLHEVIKDREAKTGTARLAYIYLANVLDAKGQIAEAERYYQKGIEYAETRGKVRPLVHIPAYRNVIDFYTRKEDYKQALKYAFKAYDIIEAYPEISYTARWNIHERLANLLELTDDHRQALFHFKQFSSVKDSLGKEKSNRRLEELRTLYETEQREREIVQLKLQEQEMVGQRNYLAIGLLILSLLVGYIFYLLGKNRNQLQTEREQKARIEGLLTEKEELLQNLERTQDQLIHNEKMSSLGQLTAGIAHEINNPINFVSTSTQALKLNFEDLSPLLNRIMQLEQHPDDPDLRAEIIEMAKEIDLPYLNKEINALLESMTRGVSRTKKIVAGLRYYTRQEEDVFRQGDLNECLEESLFILNSKIHGGITVKKNLKSIPLVYCQIEKLNQVFVNLIGNAIDAIPESGTIWVQTSAIGNQVVIEIKDSGQGMDDGTLQKIFEPFFTTKTIGKGTGLGLFISYSIIKQHHGEIAVNSTLGQGTTFQITLPVNQEELQKIP